MNWGHKILFVYVAFVAATLFLVFKASSQKDDLVTKDYYGQELKYQQRIDETERTNALSGKLQCDYKDGRLTIGFPKDFLGETMSGSVVLYCPADENKDVTKDFTIKDSVLEVAVPQDHKGAFELHISWQVSGRQYYYEQKIFI